MTTSKKYRASASLAQTLQRLQKQFGAGSIMRMGEKQRQVVEAIPSGSIGLDRALGCGGYPRGRIVEIYGPESSGKTTLALHAIAACQRAGGVAAFVDAEHALDPNYATALGVQVDELLISQPDHGEPALSITEGLVSSGAIHLVVIDSVAALTPLAELMGEMGDAHMGLQARLMSQALRKLTAAASRSMCCVIFLNQLRHKIGVTWGNGEVTTGGNALKFYATQRLDVRRISTIKENQQAVGSHTRVRVIKNKLAPPFQQAEFDIRYGQGICLAGELLDMGATSGIVHRTGSEYSHGDTSLGKGRENARTHLMSHPHQLHALREALTGINT